MPPHIVSGKPVGQTSSSRPPIPLRLCRCHDCVQNNAVDPITLAVVQGSYITQVKFKEHEKLDASRRIARTHQTAEGAASTPVPPHGPEQPSLSCSPPRSSSPPPASHGSTNAPAAPDYHVTLKDLQQTLKKYRSQDIMGGKSLIFRTPPTKDSPSPSDANFHPSMLELQDGSGIPTNAALIKHRTWLVLARDLAGDQDLLYSSDRRTKLLAFVLKNDINEEIRVLDSLIRAEWERQRASALGRDIPTVNTGGFPFIIPATHTYLP